MSEQGYDPTTDPHWMGEESPDPADHIAKLTDELQVLAAKMQTLSSPGWEMITDVLFGEMQSAALSLVAFDRDRNLLDVAYIQGQVTKIQAMLGLRERIRQQYDAKSVELAELQEPALA